ncbi:MAG: ATP-binding protein [Stappiaceae bacterium]
MSALRQTLSLTMAFLVLIFIAGVIAISQFATEFQKRIEDEMTARFALINNDLETTGFDPARYPTTRMERIEFYEQPIEIRDGFHHRLNFGWGILNINRGEDNNRGADNDWRAVNGRGQWMYLVGPSIGGQLIVGTNLGRQDDFLEIMLRTMGFVGLGAAIAALGFGLFLGARTQRRLNVISNTLAEVGAGNLKARVAASRTRDDLDDLSHQVDATIMQLEVLMRQTRDFAANIAHDLKTPLARLRIRLDRVLSSEQDDGDTSTGIEAAIAQTEKIIAIFDAFLRISKLESGAAHTAFEAIDLGLLVHEVADIYEAVVKDSGRALRVDVANSKVIQGDRVLLIQLLANLIENAMRHTPQGTSITLVAKGATLGLIDTGPGIPHDEYDLITQPLYRLEKSRTTDGAGLGLSLVKTIANLHAAELIFSENPNLPAGGLFVRVMFDKAD